MSDVRDSRVDGPIVRCLRLIRLLTEIKGDLSIKEAARFLELPASTTHRLLQILQSEGFVEKNAETQRYQAGLDLERMGSLLASRKGLRDVTRPFLQRVVDMCGEACMFVGYLPSTHQVSVMAAINSSHPLRYEIVLYEPHTVAWGATGRSILAFLPEEEQKKIVAEAGPSPVTGERLPPWPEMKRELDRIREQGYVVSHSQKLDGAVGIGAPVRDASGQIIGSFCITIPEIRFDPEAEPRLTQLIKHEADNYSRGTGAYGLGMR